jgi:YHS domain-containing protein
MLSKTKILSIILSAIVLSVVSCNQKPVQSKTDVAMNNIDSTKPMFTKEMIDNKKDPSCGMPLSSGIEDTVHYGGKVYGFCSAECKQEFLKNPAAMAKAAVMK